MESFALNFASMLLALACVLALAWFVLRMLRDRLQPRGKPGGPGQADTLRFIRALPVGTKERVVIIEHRGERWMLGVTTGGISTLAHWPADPAGAQPGVPEAERPGVQAGPASPAAPPTLPPELRT